MALCISSIKEKAPIGRSTIRGRVKSNKSISLPFRGKDPGTDHTDP